MIHIPKARVLVSLVAVLSLGCVAEVTPIRIAYNYCTLSYTFAYYSEYDWQVEVDRLADAGYNVALVTDGTFKVWQLTLRELGYCEEDILKFIPDECARAWWLMGNLTGEGGPLDQATIDDDGERGRFICEKMLERGIEPILQGYVGMMPLGHKTAIPQGKWSCYERPPILDPTGNEYAKVAEIWYRNLEKVYGIRPKYLAGDLFHEGGTTANINVTAATKAVQAAQQKAFPGVTWIVQAWQNNPTAEIRAGLDPRHTLIEALVKDMSVFAEDDSTCDLEFGKLPWVWCEVLNFGGNHGLYGNLKTFARLGRAAKGKGAKTFRGYGSLSEGFFTNPLCYALFEEMMRRPTGSEMTDVEFDAWLEDWLIHRNGFSDPRLSEAWHILVDTVYACPRCQEGTVENVMCAAPSFSVDNASAWGPRGGIWYSNAALERAAKLLDECGARREDYVDVYRQCLANRARTLVPLLEKEPNARSLFLNLIREESRLLMEDRTFRFETYASQAMERAGNRGVLAFYRMITIWADRRYGETTLADYANREYAELLAEYYLRRWEAFLRN